MLYRVYIIVILNLGYYGEVQIETDGIVFNSDMLKIKIYKFVIKTDKKSMNFKIEICIVL